MSFTFALSFYADANNNFIGVSDGYLLYPEKLENLDVCLDGNSATLTEVTLVVNPAEAENPAQRSLQFNIRQAKKMNLFLYSLNNHTLHEYGEILVGHVGKCSRMPFVMTERPVFTHRRALMKSVPSHLKQALSFKNYVPGRFLLGAD